MSAKGRVRVTDLVSVFPRGKGKIWTAEFHWQRKHCRESLATANIDVAFEKAKTIDAELRTGTYRPPRLRLEAVHLVSVSLSRAKAEFLAFKREIAKRRKKTRGKYEGVLGSFEDFCARHRVMNLEGITLRLFDQYRALRLKKVGERTIYNDFRSLKHFLKWCKKRKFIPANPLDDEEDIHRPPAPKRGGPSMSQVNSVLKEFKGYRHAALAVLAFCGVRASECQHLLATDVDFDGNWIHFVSRPDALTKSGNTWKVPLNTRLRKILGDLNINKAGWLLTENASRRYPNGEHHLNMKRLNEAFQKALAKHGVVVGKKNGGFTLHSLRSFFKSHCINQGIPREIVDAWQDHAGDHRPRASDGYYRLEDEDSQEAMRKVCFDEK